jgi:hypothetical protein
VLAPCLFAAAHHPDPRLRGNASLLMVWLSGSGRGLGQAVRVLRRIGGADGRRAASALEELAGSPGRERSAVCSLARGAVLRAAMLADDREQWTGDREAEQGWAAGG